MADSADQRLTDERARGQLNVRVPRDHLLLAKRLAAREGLTLANYIDELILKDVRDKRALFKSDIAAWKRQAELDAESFESAIEDALSGGEEE